MGSFQWNLKSLVVLGILFHCVYLFSIIDIYFRSPIVHGMTPHASSLQPPAQRVLVFVADGLRADKLFETLALVQRRDGTGKYFLRDIVEKRGRWGVSHARVPTESRPGHVALFAGFYEDVSAVTKGWKANPVEFDSVFNESARSWSWGSPDILPMFAHNVPQMYSHSYHEDSEDFASDASNLDTWVFDRVEELFASSHKNRTLNDQLHESRSVFFLHLLGIDTNGHAHRPYSSEYLENIDIVDHGVQRLYELFEQYYGDGQTTYIFTSDHGMHNKGSHGDGHPDNTETPFIVWGAGARKPHPPTARPGEKSMPAPGAWNLTGLPRFDINQADVAPLISFFAGLTYPMNSVGVLPTAYIDAPQSSVSDGLLQNALEIYEQFLRKAQMKRDHSIMFKNFKPLHDADTTIRTIRALMSSGRHEQAQELSSSLIDLSLQGLHYFQTYDWPFLLSVVSLGYVGWIAFLVLHVVAHNTNLPAYVRHRLAQSNRNTNLLAALVGAALFVFLWLESSPIQYYLYTFFPVLFWAQIYKARSILRHHLPTMLTLPSFVMSSLLVIIFLAILEVMVASYYHRELLCPVLLLVGCWPLVKESSVSGSLAVGWAACCFVLSIFPLLSVEFGSSISLVSAGGLAAFALGALPFVVKLFFTPRPAPVVVGGKEKEEKSERNKVAYLPPFSPAEARMAATQLAAVLVAVWVVSSTNFNLENKLPVPFYNHVIAWLSLASLVVLPFVFSTHPSVFLFNLFLSLAAPFTFLSISYEVLFYCALSATLYLWYYLEAALFRGQRPETLSSRATRALTVGDARIALFFLYLCYVAFFGTGNIASISSFEVSSTFRFMSIFNPWVMGALLIIKLLLPFILVSCAYHIIVASSQLDLSASFLLVIAFSDVLSLNFLFLVRDTGSWKDIGTSISHFAISNCFILFHLGIVALSSLLTSRLRLPRLVPKPDQLSL